MMRYESLMLLRPDATSDEFAALEKQFGSLVEKFRGTMVSFERWGKYRLAYPVRKENYGVYVLARFNVLPSDVAATLKELQLFFRIKCNDLVMRSVNCRLAEDAPATYQRPLSMDASGESRLDPSVRHFAESMQGEMERDFPGGNESAREFSDAALDNE